MTLRYLIPITLFAMLGLAAVPEPAQACSFSWGPGNSPREIKQRADVRRLKGTFRVIDIQGTVDEEGALDRGTITGRIETKRNRIFNTVHQYDQFIMMCGADRRPASDGTGTYWIKRKPKDGKYEILLWEGVPFQTQITGEAKK